MRTILLRCALALLVVTPLAARAQASKSASAAPSAAELKRLNARFAPVDLTADISKLPLNERQALAKIIEAAQLMDPLFLRQVWAGNPALLMELAADTSPLGRARLDAFLLHKGPWDRLEHG